jgi:hypothetical protein
LNRLARLGSSAWAERLSKTSSRELSKQGTARNFPQARFSIQSLQEMSIQAD